MVIPVRMTRQVDPPASSGTPSVPVSRHVLHAR